MERDEMEKGWEGGCKIMKSDKGKSGKLVPTKRNQTGHDIPPSTCSPYAMRYPISLPPLLV